MKSLTPPCRVQGEFVRLNMSWCVPWRVRESSVCVGVARVGGSRVCTRERESVSPWARLRVHGAVVSHAERDVFRSVGRAGRLAPR